MPSTTKKRASGNPAKRAASSTSAAPAAKSEDRYAASAWGSVSQYEDLEFPSGQFALVRRPGIEGLMKAGVLHNMDTLTPFIAQHKAKVDGKRPPEVDIEDVLKNPAMLEQMSHVLDRVLVHCVIKPEIKMSPNDPTSRQPNVIYADMVDLQDKLFLFNFAAGGTRDLERFRRESDAALGSVRAVQEDEGAA